MNSKHVAVEQTCLAMLLNFIVDLR